MSTQKIARKTRGRLTLDCNILTGLLVVLTLATDPVRESITLMSEGLTLLTCWDMCHQQILNMKDQ